MNPNVFQTAAKDPTFVTLIIYLVSFFHLWLPRSQIMQWTIHRSAKPDLRFLKTTTVKTFSIDCTSKAILELLSVSKKKANKKKPVEHVDKPGFAMVTNEVICSPAYKTLTNTARTAYTLLRAQVKKKGQLDVIYPYSHATDYMERRTFAKSIQQLIEVGFIDKKQSGGLYRRTNIYLFSDRWKGFKAGAEKPPNQKGKIEEIKEERVVAI